MKPRLALFDLDNTLLAGDSDYEWASYLIETGILDKDEYNARNDWFIERYRDGTLDIFEFLDFQLAPLSRHPRAKLDAWHADFMAKRIRPIIRPQARELVQRHAGDLCAMVTATNRFITAPIARELGIVHLIATDIEEVEGRFTGKPRGTPCFREGKIANLEAWLAARNTRLADYESWFYSDSLNDLPLLERVTHPVAVDPDDTLKKVALERHWDVVTFHEPRTGNADEHR